MRPLVIAKSLLAKIIASLLLAYPAFAATPVANSKIDEAEARLDFCQMTLAFADEFNDLQVSPNAIGKSRWIAHTPWNGDFGDAEFTDPSPGFPFVVKNGVLSIIAKKSHNGQWRSGLLSSADGEQRGFTQRYGYFETRAKLPAGPGVWPAFWLAGSLPAGSAEPSLEIDVIEYYGHEPGSFESTLHVWEKNPDRSSSVKYVMSVPKNSLTTSFRTFGAKVTETTITFYLDRKPFWQTKTPPEHKSPLMILINLAAGAGFSIERMPNPSVLQVDYVRAYSLQRPAAPPSGCR